MRARRHLADQRERRARGRPPCVRARLAAGAARRRAGGPRRGDRPGAHDARHQPAAGVTGAREAERARGGGRGARPRGDADADQRDLHRPPQRRRGRAARVQRLRRLRVGVQRRGEELAPDELPPRRGAPRCAHLHRGRRPPRRARRHALGGDDPPARGRPGGLRPRGRRPRHRRHRGGGRRRARQHRDPPALRRPRAPALRRAGISLLRQRRRARLRLRQPGRRARRRPRRPPRRRP